MATLNEAVLYLSLLTFPAERFLVMPKTMHEKKAENLTAYYFRTYRHLLNGVFILELDIQTGEITELGRRLVSKDTDVAPGSSDKGFVSD